MKTFYTNCAIILCLLIPVFSFGQKRGVSQSTQHHHGMDKVPLIHWKFYGGIGTSSYGGRVTSRFISDPSYEFIQAIDVRPTLTLGVAYKFHDHFFAKLEITNYWIEATAGSKRSKEDGWAKNPYTFRANNFDFSLMGQFNILPYSYLLGQGNRIVPYIVAGIGFTTNTPQVFDNGKWVNLNSITNQLSSPLVGVFPFGLGVNYRLSGNLEIGLDVTARYTLGGSIDGLTKKGIQVSSMNQKEADYFSQYYNGINSTDLNQNTNQGYIHVDKSQYNDVYGVVQIRASYTIIPARFQYLFNQKDLNFSNKAKGQKTKRNFKR